MIQKVFGLLFEYLSEYFFCFKKYKFCISLCCKLMSVQFNISTMSSANMLCTDTLFTPQLLKIVRYWNQYRICIFLFETILVSLLFWILCCTVSHLDIKTERQLLSTDVRICLLNIVLLHLLLMCINTHCYWTMWRCQFKYTQLGIITISF